MNRDEQIDARRVGARGALLERDEAVVVAREDDLKPLLGQRGGGLVDPVERHVLLAQPRLADGPGIRSAVPGVERHARDLPPRPSRRFARHVHHDAVRLEQVEDAPVGAALEIEHHARAGRRGAGVDARHDAAHQALTRRGAEVHAVELEEDSRLAPAGASLVAGAELGGTVQGDHHAGRLLGADRFDGRDPRGRLAHGQPRRARQGAFAGEIVLDGLEHTRGRAVGRERGERVLHRAHAGRRGPLRRGAAVRVATHEATLGAVELR